MLECPHCGGWIEVHLTPPDGFKRGSNRSSTEVQSGGSNADLNKILDLDLSSLPKGKSSKSKSTYNAQFLEFWSIYPRHQAKFKAQKAWFNAVQRVVQREGSTPVQARVQILAGAERYRDDPNRLAEFTQLAASWLNGDGWEDDPLPARIDRRREPERSAPMTDGEWARHIEHALGGPDE